MDEKYSIGEFSKKTSTTIRTLHYYDEIGILKPSYVSETGRRYYHARDLETLQRIVTLKFIGLSLGEIKELFQSEKWDLKDSLSYQRKVMTQKKEQIENVLKALDHALHVLKDHQEIEPSVFITLINSIQMEDEQIKWLKGLVDEDRVDEMFAFSEGEQLEIEKQFVEILSELKAMQHHEPEAPAVQIVIGKLMALAEGITGDVLSFVEEMSDKEVEDDEWLFHSPFTAEEEEWNSRALHYYFAQRGVMLDERNDTREHS